MKQNKRNGKNNINLSKSIITLIVIILLMALSYIINNPYFSEEDYTKEAF